MCTSQGPHGVHAESIMAEDRYAFFYQMLIIPDISTYKAWSGLYPSGRWVDVSHQGCTVSLLGYSAVSGGSFKFIFVVQAAAQIVQACVVIRNFRGVGLWMWAMGSFLLRLVGWREGLLRPLRNVAH